jgi:hypothetical protein
MDGPFSGKAGHCPARPNNVRLGVSICGWLERDLKLLDLIIHFIHMPLFIVRYFYT